MAVAADAVFLVTCPSMVHGQNTVRVWMVYTITCACAGIDAHPQPTVLVPVVPVFLYILV